MNSLIPPLLNTYRQRKINYSENLINISLISIQVSGTVSISKAEKSIFLFYSRIFKRFYEVSPIHSVKKEVQIVQYSHIRRCLWN